MNPYKNSVRFPIPPQVDLRHEKKLREDQQDNLNWQWYSPTEDSLAVNFCLDTSLHGLKYVGQQRRHVCERIFWAVAVATTIGAAAFLIWGMYQMNRDMPIVTVYNPTEKTIDQIPFPGVTICNVNNIQKSKFDEVARLASLGMLNLLDQDEATRVYAKLLDMYYICESGNTFTDKFLPGGTLGLVGATVRRIMNKTHEFEKFVNPRKTLAENSQSCEDMIMYCVWLGEKMNCSEYFQDVETDYGHCCSFNVAPASLLVRNDTRDDPEVMEAWEKIGINSDTILFTEETKDRKYPFRQRYPGREAGLSVFLDSDLEEYRCTNTDSRGFVVSLNSPLDFPRVKDHGISIPNDSEVLINVRPQITMTDKSVKKYSVKRRQCYFGDEFKLPHYTKYTASNCMDECIANRTRETCGCLRYHMPHTAQGYKKDKFCRPVDYKCVEGVRKTIYQEGLGKTCGVCLPTCTEIVYESETTFLSILEDKVEPLFNHTIMQFFKKHFLKDSKQRRHPSIVHIYFGVDSTYPRLRKESASYTELISNAGGILGLCLGFSVLSMLEIIYYVTIRLGCNWNREKSIERQQSENVVIMNYDPSTSIKLQKMTDTMKGRGWLSGSSYNPGIPGYGIHQHGSRYNTLFEKWEV